MFVHIANLYSQNETCSRRLGVLAIAKCQSSKIAITFIFSWQHHDFIKEKRCAILRQALSVVKEQACDWWNFTLDKA